MAASVSPHRPPSERYPVGTEWEEERKALKDYTPDRLRTVSVIGHGSVGKTSLCDSLVYTAGSVERLGSVDSGSSSFDYTRESRERKHSLTFSPGICEWQKHKINLLDTPGLADFYGETIGSISVSDGAVLVLDGASGVEVGSLKTWSYAAGHQLPVLIWVGGLDRENVSFERVLEEVRDSLHRHAVPFVFPVMEDGELKALVDVLGNRAMDPEGNEMEVPDEARERLDELRNELIETAAESDEELMEQYFANDTLTEAELRRGLKKSIAARDLFPVLCGVSTTALGAKELLSSMVSFIPSPLERPAQPDATGEGEIVPDPDGSFVARVFSTKVDKHVGDMVFIRVLRGGVEGTEEAYNTERQTAERLNNYYYISCGQRIETEKLVTGDIAAVAKLKSTMTNDTLCTKKDQVELRPIAFPEPVYRAAIYARKRGEEDKMGSGLSTLSAMDPTYVVRNESEIGQTTVSGMGEQHHAVMLERLKEMTGVEAELVKPRIAYHETITKAAAGQYKHKKQTGGRGQYGHVHIRLEPLPRGTGFEFDSEVTGGNVPTKHIPAVEKGFQEALDKGPLSGCAVVDIKAVVTDGSYHPVDSSDMAFKYAANRAFRAVMMQAGPILLEPLMELEIMVPEEFMGDVMGDINSRRGKIQGMEAEGSFQIIKAQVPEAELYQYTSTLRSLTQARGNFSQTFSHYEKVPRDIQQKVAEENRRAAEEDE